jgi:Ca-activated chloride channel family protein
MKSVLKLFSLLVIAGTMALMIPGYPPAHGRESEDKTLSPYFFVQSDDPALDRLPLKSTFAVVSIAGVIADVQVTQVYKNEGQRPIEAVYTFPASTKAVVYGMKMSIGERTIIAKVRERDQARREYEQAREQGRSASLLEQQRPNVFQMNVANIMPGDEIRVELKYTELLVPAEGVYEFIYPTVVGPRYSNQPAANAPPSEKWVQSPYLHQGQDPPYGFDITVNLVTGVPLQAISSSSHKVDIQYRGPSQAAVRLSPSEKAGGNRDFILKYRLAGGSIESGLLLYPGEKENFFLLMLEPPQRVSERQIPPREYIFIVDVSGSMHGFPIDISKKLLRDLIGHLRPTDRFNVLLFSGGSALLANTSLPATPANVTTALDLINRQQGGGGTELLPALKRALTIPRAEGFSRTVVIATDGYVHVEAETFDLIRAHLGDANFFPFGIGTSVNRFIVEGMARAGMGESFVITKPEEARGAAERFRKYIQSPVLTRVRVDFGGFGAYDIEPAGIPDVLAERPVIVFGKWRGVPEGRITIRGIAGSHDFEKQLVVNDVKPLTDNAALRYLWARHRIALLGDYEKLQPASERVKEITHLGLTYNLLTAYTSFVAIDTVVRRQGGDVTTVQQPLPLPQGVSDLAVGKGGPYAPMSMALKEAKPEMSRSEDRAQTSKRPAEKRGIVLVDLKAIVWTGDRPAEEYLTKKEKWQRYLKEVEDCYNNLLKKHPGLLGKMTVVLAIGPNGQVQKASIAASDLQHPTLEACIIQKVKSWNFPVLAGKGTMTLTVPLVFKP